MKVEFTHKFRKQVLACNDHSLTLKISAIINEISNAKTLHNIKNIKKLIGHKDKYRIKLGSYRIGIVIHQNTVIFAAFDKRSDIYKYFP